MPDVLDLVSSALMEDAAFNNELEAWCRAHCGVFSEAEEHKLEYTELHETFCQLFEKKITAILEGGGHSGMLGNGCVSGVSCFVPPHGASTGARNLTR